MITLGMDCASNTVAVALLDGETLVAEMDLCTGKHHAEVLLPALDKLLGLTGIRISDIDLLACTVGPGSFTGVRMGASTAKGIALAIAKPIVGVSTLEALAMNALPCRDVICPVLDARRGQVYAGSYRMGRDGLPESLAPDRLIDIEQWISELPEADFECIGDGAVRYRDRIRESLRARCLPAWDPRHRVRAGAVGLLGVRDFSGGRRDDALTFMPKYLRPPGIGSEAVLQAQEAATVQQTGETGRGTEGQARIDIRLILR